MKTTKSKLLSLNLFDLAKGAIVASFMAIITAIGQAINNKQLPQTKDEWLNIFILGLGAGIAYLIKNLFSAPEIQTAITDIEATSKQLEAVMPTILLALPNLKTPINAVMQFIHNPEINQAIKTIISQVVVVTPQVLPEVKTETKV
jgi:hypothetical protein